MRTLASSLQHEVSKFCSVPSHSSEYCRKERLSPCFYLVYIGNEKKLDLPALCRLWSISHTVLVIWNEWKNILQTVTVLSGQDQDVKWKGGGRKGLNLLKTSLGRFCFIPHSTYMLTDTHTQCLLSLYQWLVHRPVQQQNKAWCCSWKLNTH